MPLEGKKLKVNNAMRQVIVSIVLLVAAVTAAFTTSFPSKKKPNVILIMADDLGYETLGINGGISYNTPVLDSLAANGILFSHCVSQPLCTPSRVKIMTGLYNYRNYDRFGHLSDDQKTFGNLFKDAGYKTCIVGKWQLNGLSYKNEVKNWADNTRPVHFGFDNYCLWQLTKAGKEGERYADPLIEKDGKVLLSKNDDYGPDIFSDYILDFVEKNKDQPFFVYYPMVLVHDPFVPTPDSKNWSDRSERYTQDTLYFRDMVQYMDKIVGRITYKLKELNLDQNTIIIFTGDNGTSVRITTQTREGMIKGDKGNTTTAGTHVPLLVNWGRNIKTPFMYTDLVEFSDFYSTFADLLGIKVKVDGKSFWDVISGKSKKPYRTTATVYYDPKWGTLGQYKNLFVRSKDYKLYQDNKFIDLINDPLEKNPLSDNQLTEAQNSEKQKLTQELKRHPKVPL